MQSPIQHKAHGLAQLPGRHFEVLWGSMSCCAMRRGAPCLLHHSAGKLRHALLDDQMIWIMAAELAPGTQVSLCSFGMASTAFMASSSAGGDVEGDMSLLMLSCALRVSAAVVTL